MSDEEERLPSAPTDETWQARLNALLAIAADGEPGPERDNAARQLARAIRRAGATLVPTERLQTLERDARLGALARMVSAHGPSVAERGLEARLRAGTVLLVAIASLLLGAGMGAMLERGSSVAPAAPSAGSGR
jgi:hypothetical protein